MKSRHTCQICGRVSRIHRDGSIEDHSQTVEWWPPLTKRRESTSCPGSGRPPYEVSITAVREALAEVSAKDDLAALFDTAFYGQRLADWMPWENVSKAIYRAWRIRCHRHVESGRQV